MHSLSYSREDSNFNSESGLTSKSLRRAADINNNN
jgi:hypothetical protein